MFAVLFLGLFAGASATSFEAPLAVVQDPKEPPKGAGKATPASELTRSKLLKAKVTIERKEERIGDILKELAGQVEMQTEHPVMWNYGMGFPFAKRVTFTATDLTLEAALDQLFKQAGGTLGYVVVSKEGDRHDGWVRLTTSGERGTEPQPATEQEEKDAADKLADAKKLIDAKKSASAKVFLDLVVKKYPTTKAAVEAKALLEKIDR